MALTADLGGCRSQQKYEIGRSFNSTKPPPKLYFFASFTEESSHPDME